MGPELYTKAGGTHKVDIFAFAVTIFELYALVRAFAGVGDLAIGDMVKAGKRPPLASVAPADVRELIAASWQQDPARRPEMADVVATIESGGSVGGGGGGGDGRHGARASAGRIIDVPISIIAGFSMSEIGKRCTVALPPQQGGPTVGTLKWVGLHPVKKEPRVGVMFDSPVGMNDGTLSVRRKRRPP